MSLAVNWNPDAMRSILEKPGPRDWVEDFEHENGNYLNVCCVCDYTFKGHKRRVCCKLCQG